MIGLNQYGAPFGAGGGRDGQFGSAYSLTQRESELTLVLSPRRRDGGEKGDGAGDGEARRRRRRRR